MTTFSLARRGMSVEDIADIVSVSAQTVQEWLSGADLVKYRIVRILYMQTEMAAELQLDRGSVVFLIY